MIISFIMAAKNTSRYISQAVTSILSQEIPEGWILELNVGVDNCEETLKEVQKIVDNRLSVWYTKTGLGPYVMRNSLLDKCSGEIMGCFDSDDVLMPGIVKESIEEIIDGGFDVVNYWADFTDENLIRKNKVNRGGCHSSIIYSRKVLDTLGGYEPWVCQADTEFCKRAKAFGFKFKTIQRIGMLYRRHPTQMTAVIPRGSVDRNLVQEEIGVRVSSWSRGKTPHRVSRKVGCLEKIS